MAKAKTHFQETEQVAAARRKALEKLVEEVGGVTSVATRADVDRVHIEKLIAGGEHGRDILALRSDTIAKLLPALSLSDERAQTELNIPEHLRKRWTTLRPLPMGGGIAAHNEHWIEIVLKAPLTGVGESGVVTLPRGYTIWIDRSNVASGDVVIRVDGNHRLAPASAIPKGADLLGQLVRVDAIILR